MRLISPACLKSGMILGKNLYGSGNQLLLSQGQILSENSIKRIQTLENQSVFITDDLLEDKEQEEGINHTLKKNAFEATKEIFINLEYDNMLSTTSIIKAKNIVDEMIQEILSIKGATVSMTDLQLFDEYTYQHSVNVTVISLILGMVMGMGREQLRRLGLGAILHDIGKIFVPKEILNKPSSLTPEEFSQVKDHSRKGYEYLTQKQEISADSRIVALTHHEKYDGSGYPDGLKGEKIHKLGRIVAVADVYDALTANRPYRKALLPSEAMEYILGNCGSHFDPDVVEIFFQKVSLYPIGTHVVLSNGMEGVVVQNRPRRGLRPKVRIISDEVKPIFYDLANDMKLLNITITGIKDR